jgi:hypothetical protein
MLRSSIVCTSAFTAKSRRASWTIFRRNTPRILEPASSFQQRGVPEKRGDSGGVAQFTPHEASDKARRARI